MKNARIGMLLALVGLYCAYGIAQITSYETNPVWVVVAVVISTIGIVIHAFKPNNWSRMLLYITSWTGFGLWLGLVLNQFRNLNAWVFSAGVACALCAGLAWLFLNWFIPTLSKPVYPWLGFLALSIVAAIINAAYNPHGFLAINLGTFPYPESQPSLIGYGFIVLWSTLILLWIHRSTEKLASEGMVYAGVAPLIPFSVLKHK